MLFNSVDFLIFFVVVFALYSVLPHLYRKVLLLASSYFFYGCWDYRFLSLLAISTVVDYFCARALHRSEHEQVRTRLLLVSLVVNLGFLLVFKYCNFFIQSAVDLSSTLGWEASYSTLNIVLPVGISFYTFQTLSYTIDVYRRQLEPTNSFLDFATYVAFFPQLVAGPIECASNLLPQFAVRRSVSEDNLITGIWLILLGFFKKLVIADRCAMLVNAAFADQALPYSGAEDWLWLYAFAFQVYGDFSGYSDIARGIAKMMGYDLMLNFRKPFLVSNPSEFWRHWHISLSTWLRDYLYISLGGSRRTLSSTYRNLMITMILGGLWHGAGWAYLLWGTYQGLLLVTHRFLKPWFDRVADLCSTSRVGRYAWQYLAWFLFFHLTCIGWLLFRAGSLPPEIDQLQFIRTSFVSLLSGSFTHADSSVVRTVVVMGAMTFVVQAMYQSLENFYLWSTRSQVIGAVTILVAIATLGVFEGAEFIYFQF